MSEEEPAAKSLFAYMLQQGEGGSVDAVRARQLYEQAVGAGNTFAMNHLAYMLEQGKGGDADCFTARVLYEKAVDQGIFLP